MGPVMRVTAVCFGRMRDFLPDDAEGNRAVIEVDDGATAADLVDALGAPRGIVHAVLVGDVPGSLDRALTEGEEITLMPQFTGGC